MRPSDWLGYAEHLTPQYLNHFDENVGKGGCTIFAQMIWETQGAYLMGLPWCAVFVHAVINRPDLLGRAHPGCRVLQRRMRRKGLWRGREYHPRPGDLCFCSTAHSSRVDHVGIVEGADGKYVTTIDGNSVDPSGRFRPEDGGVVSRRTRLRTDPVIVGFGALSERSMTNGRNTRA